MPGHSFSISAGGVLFLSNRAGKNDPEPTDLIDSGQNFEPIFLRYYGRKNASFGFQSGIRWKYELNEKWCLHTDLGWHKQNQLIGGMQVYRWKNGVEEFFVVDSKRSFVYLNFSIHRTFGLKIR
jgi:hypothetical protein